MSKLQNNRINWETNRSGLLLGGGEADLYKRLIDTTALKLAIENAFDGVKIRMQVEVQGVVYWLELSSIGKPAKGVQIVCEPVDVEEPVAT